jgi:hypothetical protein
MATPFGAWGGFPNDASPGFSGFLRRQGYSNEKNIIDLIPNLDPVQQVKLDISLNMDGINIIPSGGKLLYDNAKDKRILIPIFKGEERDPNIIKQAIELVQKSKESHKNRVASQWTGSDVWNTLWIRVYDQWLEKLKEILNEA